MDWATKRKLVWFAGAGAIALLIIGYFVYSFFFKAAPTCFDNTQNQDERGVDCGGICAMVCPMDARTIVPLWTRVFPVAPGVSNVVAYLENQNVTAGVKKINYEFRVYDGQNILVGEPISGSTFIGPNDRTAIFESPIQTGNRIASSAFFAFTEGPEWTTADVRFQTPQLISANAKWIDIETVPKLSVDIVNNTLFDYKNIEVVVIAYGADGNAVTASKTFLEMIPQQSTKSVSFTWPRPFGVPITRTEIIPRINPFIQEM